MEASPNPPLAEHADPSVRRLASVPDLLVAEGDLPAEVRNYQEQRPEWFGDPSRVLDEWRVGYLPPQAMDAKTAGAIRGQLVFTLRNSEGVPVALLGRNPKYEQQLARYQANGSTEHYRPHKWTLVPKGFQRRYELYGQDRIVKRGSKKLLNRVGGLYVVEGPGDVIRLSRRRILAVALLSNTPTDEQIEKIAELAWNYADGRVMGMLDMNVEGRRGMGRLAFQLCLDTYFRAAWTSRMFGGEFSGAEPENLTDEQLDRLQAQHAAKAPKRVRGVFT